MNNADKAALAVIAKEFMITLELPLPPTINHYYKLAKGRKYISADGQAYRSVVRWNLRQWDDVKFPIFPSERLHVRIELVQSDRRRRSL